MPQSTTWRPFNMKLFAETTAGWPTMAPRAAFALVRSLVMSSAVLGRSGADATGRLGAGSASTTLSKARPTALVPSKRSSKPSSAATTPASPVAMGAWPPQR